MLTKANGGPFEVLNTPTIANGSTKREVFINSIMYLTISVSLAALVVAVVVPPVPRGRVEARLRSRVLPRRRRLGALLRLCGLLSLLRRDLNPVRVSSEY